MHRNKKERKRRKAKQIQNRKLCRRYPFLIPRNRWTGEIVWETYHDKYTYPYCYTELDDMDKGWRKAFGIQMCEEIRKELLKYNFLYKYRIMQIKEKFGELRWYDAGAPRNSNIWNIIDKYTMLSRHTCYCCGRPAKITNDGGWLITMCPDCIKKMKKRIQRFIKNDNNNN